MRKNSACQFYFRWILLQICISLLNVYLPLCVMPVSGEAHVRWGACQVRHMSGEAHVRWSTCQVKHMSGEAQVKWGTCLVKHVSGEAHVRWGTCQVRHRSSEAHVRWGTGQVRHRSSEAHVRWGTLAQVKWGTCQVKHMSMYICGSRSFKSVPSLQVGSVPSNLAKYAAFVTIHAMSQPQAKGLAVGCWQVSMGKGNMKCTLLHHSILSKEHPSVRWSTHS